MEGVFKLSDEDLETFERDMLKGKKLKLMLFQLDEKANSIVFKFSRPSDYDYDKLKEELPKDDGAIILVDFDYKAKDGKNSRTLVAVNYAPTSIQVTRRFRYPLATKGIASQLKIPVDIQASDWAQMDYETLISHLDK